VLLIEDLGSGALADFASFGLEHEPTVGESLASGCDVVTCSGDKLLGGSQAGLVLGKRRWLGQVRKDPLARALRLDKLTLAALEATLPLYAVPGRAVREVPVLAMLRLTPEELQSRARRLARGLEARVSGLSAKVMPGYGEVGGGALPLQRLPGWVVEVQQAGRDAHEIERHARATEPPVIGTIRAGRWRLDPRTLSEAELEEVVDVLAAALTAPEGSGPDR
jgi:L-seryl-tRNA(Ser) seleniumtransferase